MSQLNDILDAGVRPSQMRQGGTSSATSMIFQVNGSSSRNQQQPSVNQSNNQPEEQDQEEGESDESEDDEESVEEESEEEAE